MARKRAATHAAQASASASGTTMRPARLPAGTASQSADVAHTLPTPLQTRHVAASPAMELSGQPGTWLAGVVLEIVGAEHATLSQQLTIWQREQDRALNRAWRRPGGLARPAGL